jgi:hypothetical protein
MNVDVGQQHEALGARHLRDPRGEPVVVPVPDLGRRDRVVLVDHRDRAQCQQSVQRGARVQITAPILGVVQRQQHLRGREAARLEDLLPGTRQPDLADRGRGLALLQPESPRGQPQMPTPHRDRARGDDDHLLAPLGRAGEIVGEALQPGAVEAAGPAVHQQGRTNLDHQAAGVTQASRPGAELGVGGGRGHGGVGEARRP